MVVRSGSGFDFTTHIRRVCEDMVVRLAELGHIDMPRVAISMSQTRTASPYGVQASLTPLRFAGGSRVEKRRGRYYKTQLVLDSSGKEMLYILTFYLPRFMNLEFREKLITIVHELWHIGPTFDGDLRRHKGRCYAHTGSKRNYDRQMERLVDTWLAQTPESGLYRFLSGDCCALRAEHGRIYGTRYARPRMVPVTAEEAHQLDGQVVPGGDGKPTATG